MNGSFSNMADPSSRENSIDGKEICFDRLETLIPLEDVIPEELEPKERTPVN